MSLNSNKMYHGCSSCYVDGTMALISKNGSCGTPTDYPFWKDVEDVSNNARTRNQLKRRTPAPKAYINSYFEYKSLPRDNPEQTNSEQN